MITHLSQEKSTPWWAVVGAPLVGIPILVALLAFAAPAKQANAATDEAMEQVEAVQPHEAVSVSASNI